MGVPLVSTDGETLGSDEHIILGSIYGDVLSCTLRGADAVTFGVGDGSDMCCSDVSFEGSNDSNSEGSLLGVSLG